jgi:antitoxin ParD1/3/4
MRVVSVKIPESYLEIIDRLVDVGRYTCRSEFIRTAVRKLIDEELARGTPKQRVEGAQKRCEESCRGEGH